MRTPLTPGCECTPPASSQQPSPSTIRSRGSLATGHEMSPDPPCPGHAPLPAPSATRELLAGDPAVIPRHGQSRHHQMYVMPAHQAERDTWTSDETEP